MTPNKFKAWVDQARLAPSVHNVQPARWRIESDALVLVEDMSRRLKIGDPAGNDTGISLGAAFEGLALAASQDGFELVPDDSAPLPMLAEPLRPVRRYLFRAGSAPDPLAAFVTARASWRGAFVAPSADDRNALAAMAAPDALVVTDPDELQTLAQRYDAASFSFMRDTAFRDELRGWMRFQSSHPNWTRDGLNAAAMALSPFEATAAAVVLGPAFQPLSAIGLAGPLVAEGEKIRNAAGLILFHRDLSESPFESGRHFYRLWLKLEALGFSAAVLAALADERETARHLCQTYGIGTERRLVSAFRAGRLGAKQPAPRARLALTEVLV
ncbi:MAG: hypothetical protein RL230_2558 [Pseudomonadota bacterium]